MEDGAFRVRAKYLTRGKFKKLPQEPLLPSLFDSLLTAIEGKLIWSKTKKWTTMILGFLQDEGESRGYEVRREYLRIDLAWWNLQQNFIELAVEHESFEKRLPVLLDTEIQHLIDVRAKKKLVVVYPSMGDENPLVEYMGKRINSRNAERAQYCLMCGHSTRREGKPVMLFNGYFFDEKEWVTKTRQRAISKKSGKTES